MAVRRVPDDHPDVQSAINASVPGDRIEASAAAPEYVNAVVTVDGLTIEHAGGFFSSDALTLAPGVRSLSLPGLTLSRTTGNDGDNAFFGGPVSSYFHGLGGGDVLLGGPGADWLEGGTGDDTYEVDDTTGGGGLGGGNRVPLFRGDQVVERPDEGWDAVWSSVDYTLPGHVEALVLIGSARKGYGNEAANLLLGNGEANLLAGFGGGDEMRESRGGDTYLVNGRGDRVVEDVDGGVDEVWASVDYELPANAENLFLDGAAVWGSGNATENRILGNDLGNRLVGWEGSDTMTGGAGDDVFFALMTQASRSTITDFSPGAGSGDQVAFSRDLFTSREQALAASWQAGADVWVVRDYTQTVVLQNTRLADLTLDDFLIA